MLITDENGERLYSTTSTLSDSVLDEIAVIATVTDSMYSRINSKLNIEDKELTVIVNKLDYIVIKQMEGAFVILAQVKRKVDIDLIYDKMNKLAEELSKV